MQRRCLVFLGLFVWAACSNPASTGANGKSDDGSDGSDALVATPGAATDLSALQRKKAEMLTSIWENGTTVLQYAYCEDINDRRGFTSGRAGFCSGTGDAVLVVKCATDAAASNPMAKYIPALNALTATYESTGEDQANTSTLTAVGDYCGDWASAASAAAFKGCEDSVVGTLYFGPAIAEANRWGLRTALTSAELYDASINHGEDGMQDLAKKAGQAAGVTAGGAALTQDVESRWLEAFLLARVKLLAGDDTWRESVDRVAVYEQARREGNFDFTKPLHTDVKAKPLFPSVAGLIDSEYPSCVIAANGTVAGAADCTNPSP